MIRWFSSQSRRSSPSSAPQPRSRGTSGRLVYAIGDIHGRDDLLAKLLAAMRADAEAANAGPPIVIVLGDMIDRGPSSRQVLERIAALGCEGWCDVRALKGNHEEAMLAFLAEPEGGGSWLEFGGGETLASYGVSPVTARSGRLKLEAAAQALASAMGPDQRSFLEGLERYAVVGDHLFIHAGVRPGVPLDQQIDRDIFWIRSAFLNHPSPSDLVVVHGHTPTSEPFLGDGRIGVDTGAYASGVLTAVRLIDSHRAILQSRI